MPAFFCAGLSCSGFLGRVVKPFAVSFENGHSSRSIHRIFITIPDI
jgi:hypothetical protein